MKWTQWGRIVFAAVVMFGGLQVASAGPIEYNLAFSITGGGSVQPTGAFSYDASLAVNPFSAFDVMAGGLTFDLTSAANGYSGDSFVGACKSAQSAAGFFNALTTAGCENSWVYTPSGSVTADFTINACSATADPCSDGAADTLVVAAGTGTDTQGLASATPSAVPEPGTAAFLGIGVLALLGAARTRLAR